MTEMTFLSKRAMFHPLKQRGCFWRQLLLIYYTYNYVSYTYFTVYVEVCVCFEISRLTSGLCMCVCVYVCVCVVYEDRNVYNDMGMTGITRRR